MFKHEYFCKKFYIDIDINYDDVYNCIKKDIIDFDISKLTELIIDNQSIRTEFYAYLMENKDNLKSLVWNELVKRIKMGTGDIMNSYIQIFYTRIFEYCNCLDDFRNTLLMTTDVYKVLKIFLSIIFINVNEVEGLYWEIYDSLKNEKDMFDEKDFKVILKKEFLEELIERY